MDEAVLLSGDARYKAYAELDRDLTTNLLPAVTFAAGVATHFVSARVGCEVLHRATASTWRRSVSRMRSRRLERRPRPATRGRSGRLDLNQRPLGPQPTDLLR